MSNKDVDYKSLVQGRAGVEQKSAGPVTKQFPALLDIKSVDAKNRRITALASTGSVDRYDEIILPEAFQESLKEYVAKNNIVLCSHQHKLETGHSPVVANVIEARITTDGLEVVIEFHDITELAEEYWQLYSQKKQRALSVGFGPQEGRYEEREGKRVYVHTRVELMEISVVPVGANREALTRGQQRKADFVAAKKNQTAEEEQYQQDLQGLLEKEPGFDEKAEDFAEVLLGVKETGIAIIDDPPDALFDTDALSDEKESAGGLDCAGIVSGRNVGEYSKFF